MKKKFDWDEFCDKKNKIAVHCSNRKEATLFCDAMHKHGLTWRDGDSYLRCCWDYCNPIHYYTNNGTYEDFDYCKNKDYMIYDFSEFDFPETDNTEHIHLVPHDNSLSIKIKYHNPDLQKLEYIDGKSDWIDLRAAEDVVMKQGEFKLISLGVSMQLPEGYEAHVVPRSSTFKNFGVLQTNNFGVIDESFCGQTDVWMFPALAMRDTEIHVNDRICQFRIELHQPKIVFDEVEKLNGENRSGFGSTGKN